MRVRVAVFLVGTVICLSGCATRQLGYRDCQRCAQERVAGKQPDLDCAKCFVIRARDPHRHDPEALGEDYAEEYFYIAVRRGDDLAGDSNQTQKPVPPQLLGIALSGGGIRSASFSLGVLQALAESGGKEEPTPSVGTLTPTRTPSGTLASDDTVKSAFDQLDYMSAVSGGAAFDSTALLEQWQAPVFTEAGQLVAGGIFNGYLGLDFHAPMTARPRLGTLRA